MRSEKRAALMMRVGVVFFALVLGLMAIAALVSGRFTYRNYWRGDVFAPLALVVAILFVIAGFKITRPETGHPRRLSRKQKKLEDEARKTRFPIDDFDKPWTGGM